MFTNDKTETETCSWCCDETLVIDMYETDEGNLCRTCYDEFITQ